MAHQKLSMAARFLRAGVLRRLIRVFNHISCKKKTSVLLCGLLGFVLPAAYGLLAGIPAPRGHDEFSYLLAADTFALGRAANPTHPMWVHFEAPHILHVPRYASKYPPGQGLALAAGQVAFGHPIYGVWLSVGAFSAALCWMLQEWTKPRWALVGALVMIMMLGVKGYWSQRYWGGMVAATGGALFLGSFRRVLYRPDVCGAVVMAAGAIILANTRPFEGLVVALPALSVFLVWLPRGGRGEVRKKLLHVFLPAAAVLLAGGIAMLQYNKAVTGNPLVTPYAAHHPQYFRVPLFVFQPENPSVQFRHERLRRFSDEYQARPVKVMDFFYAPRGMLAQQLSVWLGPVLWITLLMTPCMLADPWLRFAALTWFALVFCMCFATFFGSVHYAAPITCLAYLFSVEGLRRLRTLQGRGAVVPRLKARYVLLVVCLTWGVWEGPTMAHAVLDGIRSDRASTEEENPARMSRQEVADLLQQKPGRHLVLVSYEKDYTVHDEWVYNGAEIDKAKIVWAHDMGEAQNRPLLRYYQDRTVWLLEVGQESTKLKRRSQSGPGRKGSELEWETANHEL